MKSIFVGNLSYSVTENTLRSLFEAYGAVERVSVMTERDTGEPRGFGFVDMTNNEEAVKAIAALNGKDVEGRTLDISEARPKADRPGGGSFRRKR
jgi:cold-inducible RNA-binding protein